MPINSSRTRKPYLNEQLQRGVASAQGRQEKQFFESDASRSAADPERNVNKFMEDREPPTEAERTRSDEQFWR